MPRIILSICVVVVFLATLLFLAYWFLPSGVGESEASPDGRFRASIMNYQAGKITGHKEPYIQIQILDVASGKTLWRANYFHEFGASVPNYIEFFGDFIEWSPDSREVRLLVADGKKISIPVP